MLRPLGRVLAFVKNDHLGFTIPYLHNGQPHDYVPDFLVQLKTPDPRPTTLILETKGCDPLKEFKKQAAERWCAAVNAEGSYGHWLCRVARAHAANSCSGVSPQILGGADRRASTRARYVIADKAR